MQNLGECQKSRNTGEYRKGGIRVSAGKVESGRVPEKWDLGEYRKSGIRESTEKVGSGRVPERWDSRCTGKVGFGRVPEKGPGEYQKGGIRASIGEGSG